MALFSWLVQCTILDQNQHSGQQGVCCRLPDPLPELVCPRGTECVYSDVCNAGGTIVKDVQGYDTVSYCSFPSSDFFCIILLVYLFALLKIVLFFHFLPVLWLAIRCTIKVCAAFKIYTCTIKEKNMWTKQRYSLICLYCVSIGMLHQYSDWGCGSVLCFTTFTTLGMSRSTRMPKQSRLSQWPHHQRIWIRPGKFIINHYSSVVLVTDDIIPAEYH